jgi:heat shock protein HslJ
MRVRVFQLALTLSLVSAVACNSSQKPATKTPAAPASAPTSLVGTEWLLTDLAGTPVVANSKASISFLDAGRAAGNGSCNRFTGAFTTAGETIKLGPFASTRMACMDGGVSAQEDQYLKLLTAANRYQIKDGALLIYADGVEKPLIFSRQATTKP